MAMLRAFTLPWQSWRWFVTLELDAVLVRIAGLRCLAIPPPLAALLVASAVLPGEAAVGVRRGGLHAHPAALFSKPRWHGVVLDESGEVLLGHVHRLHGQGYALRGSDGGREGRAPLLPTAEGLLLQVMLLLPVMLLLLLAMLLMSMASSSSSSS